jgi:hypothetical protein
VDIEVIPIEALPAQIEARFNGPVNSAKLPISTYS